MTIKHPMGELSGQVALVTGASYGLGRAITEELLRLGACVMLTDVTDRVIHTTRELKDAGFSVDHCHIDITSRDSVAAGVKATVERFGKIDIFVNNAGWSKVMKPFIELTMEDWDTYMAINVRGNLFCMQEAALAMRTAGRGGRFIAIASTAAVKPYKRAAAYCTSKAAIPMLVKAAALELAEYGITVNCVGPGPTTTETNIAHTSGAIDPEVAQAKSRRDGLIPLGKNEPEDIAKAVAYFAQPSARRVTGQLLLVEGGGQLIS